MPPRTLQNRAKTARIRAGFRIPQEAADAIGCSRPTVIAWESGAAKSIGSRYLLDAAKAYKVRPEWLTLESDDDGYPWSPERVSEQQARTGTASQSERPNQDKLPASQLGRPDFDKISGTVTVLREYLATLGDPPEWISDPVMLEACYVVVEEFGEPVSSTNVVELMKRFGKKIRSTGGVHGRRQIGGVG